MLVTTWSVLEAEVPAVRRRSSGVHAALRREPYMEVRGFIHVSLHTVIKVFKHEGIDQGEKRPVNLDIERAGKRMH